jgi:hypothetical protein
MDFVRRSQRDGVPDGFEKVHCSGNNQCSRGPTDLRIVTRLGLRRQSSLAIRCASTTLVLNECKTAIALSVTRFVSVRRSYCT